jgi:pimeloyl-ACP methyl ester carboxylesterase
MKLLHFLFFLFPTFLRAQLPDDRGAFNQTMDAKTFAGKKFKLEATVKIKPIDSVSEAELWVRVDRSGGKTGFFYNMMDKPIRTREWKSFTIQGKVDRDAKSLVFGGLYAGSGIFYFDNFKLFIETTNGNFEQIKIPNGDFEDGSLQYWQYYQKRNGFSTSLTKETSFSGTQCIVVDGSQLKDQMSFGNNANAGKYVLVNGIKMYYEEYGTGEPLLLLHGNSESIQSFRLQIPEFSKFYRVIAVDTRGQGKSSEDGKTYTYDLFAEDINALLNNLNIDSANILGWSDGGNTGLILAMKYSQKVKKLVTMGANIFIDKSVVDKWVFKELRKQLKELAHDTSYAAQNRIRLINLLLTEPKHNFADLKTIACPVLVMAGEKDIVKLNHTNEIAKSIPHSTLIIAQKQTHYYPVENAGAFNKTVLDYFRH